MIYFTSDTHFSHKNILAYEPITRPFKNIDEMNEYIVERWQERITDEDEVYVLGDFFMGQLDKIQPILDRLPGKIHLIRGNHDQKNRIKIYEENGIDVKDLDYIKYKGRFFILCHFPNNNEEFIRMITQDNSEVVWLYGHVHSNAPYGYHDGTFHIGCDTNNLTPISIEEVWKQCWPEEIMTPEVKEYKKKAETDLNYEQERNCARCEYLQGCLRGRLAQVKNEKVICNKYSREIKDGGFYH